MDEASLADLLDETERIGHAVSEGEFDPGTRALGVPVRVSARVVATLTLIEHRDADLDDDLLDHLPALLAGAEGLASALTHRARRRDRS